MDNLPMNSFPVVTPPDQPEANQRTGQQDILPFAVKNRNVDTITWDKGFGGSLTLGGFNNKNGVLYIKDALKNTIIKGDNLGHHYYNTSGNELVRVDWVGLKTFNTSAVKLSQFDATGSHFYDALNNEIIRVDTSGLHGYNTSANEIVKVDTAGLHNYNTSAQELTRFDYLGSHFYDGLNHELTRVDTVGFHTYDTSGNELMRVSTGIFAYGNLTSVIQLKATPSDVTPYGQIGYLSASNFFYVLAQNGKGFAASGDNAAITQIQSQGGGNCVIAAFGGGDIVIQGNANKFLLYNGTSNVSVIIDGDAGTGLTRITRSGYTAKLAIVPTSKGYNALYCAESPEVWFFDYYKDKVDPLFLEVTEPPYHEILCKDGWTRIEGKRKGMANMRFTPKTAQQFQVNNAFWSIPDTKPSTVITEEKPYYPIAK